MGISTGDDVKRARSGDGWKNADALVFEDYNKGVCAAFDRRCHRGRSRSTDPFVVDPKFRNFFAYRGATMFKPIGANSRAAIGAAVDLEH